MRKAQDPNNRRLFKLEEIFTPQQISSYFSCFAVRRKQLSEPDYEAAENEHVLQEVREDIMLSLEQDVNRYKHPIIHGEFQLCNMPEDELSLLRMATLKPICKEYGIDVSGRNHMLRNCFFCGQLYLQVVQLNFVKKIQVTLL